MRPDQSVTGRILFYFAQLVAITILGVVLCDLILHAPSGSSWGPYRVVPAILFLPFGLALVRKIPGLWPTAAWIWILPLLAFGWEASVGTRPLIERLRSIIVEDYITQIIVAVPLASTGAYSVGAWWASRKKA